MKQESDVQKDYVQKVVIAGKSVWIIVHNCASVAEAIERWEKYNNIMFIIIVDRILKPWMPVSAGQRMPVGTIEI